MNVRVDILAAKFQADNGQTESNPQLATSGLTLVVLQVSNADKFVAERLSCVLRLPRRKGCR